MKVKTFLDYKAEASNWITLAGGEYYPDILKDACALYKPVLILFGQLVKSSESSSRLFLGISEIAETWMRVQLLRVFLSYAKKKGLNTRLLFVNDGPGLLLGSMWNDYAALESNWKGKVMVLTLRMVTERITKEWLLNPKT